MRTFNTRTRDDALANARGVVGEAHAYLQASSQAPRGHGAALLVARLKLVLLECLALEGDAFTQGRKQGWKDAGLSLDAQETLARSITPHMHVAGHA
jgi:hypothetical protein